MHPASDRPIVVEDLETETRFGGPELPTSHDVRSGISTISGPYDEPWGILGTHDTERRTFTDEDVAFIRSVATVLAEAIERHRYQRELEGLVADLETSNERLEQFAYAASHDLQEPLRMVSSYLQLVERRDEDELDAKGREFLEFAVDGADRMRSMIDGLLAYSRVETRGEPFRPIDLEDVVADVRDDLDVRFGETDAELSIEELPRVEGEERQIRQAFQNPIDNAVTYSGDDPPRIRVSAERNGTVWTVSVSDGRLGIDPADQEHVFEIFQRVTLRDERAGAGIGLALCERIVERHDGDIWVESEPGEGSTFSFTLPAVDERGG
ncbi:ATP-binding protein [Halovivax sp.]|uniref:sensor histidine kinase n=1 Tax=Halovivax sp. TaxID=1935978 RepID=UPI0025B7E618|nr:ATP-binding protein [Halovivax sp.]